MLTRWYWIAPLAAGTRGYIAGFKSPDGLETGDLTSTFAALCRVLPLDYASLGMAGVMVGYWWMMPEEGSLEAAARTVSRDAAEIATGARRFAEGA